jgi:phosphoribosylformylglycinamidine (FGAM) synthase-like enzyme
VVVAGGKTGRDGIRGVTFASEQLTEESTSVSYTAVQIGNPIVEKKLIDVLLEARDLGLYRRITDCGGGGLSSAVGEMAASTGVRVELDKVTLKYAGLSYTEIWISESQERMLLAVPPEHIDSLRKLFAGEGVDATVIGEFTADRRLRLFYHGSLVADLSMEFLHKGRPQVERKATWEQPHHPEPDFAPPPDLNQPLLQLLGSWNVCSKEWVIRQYDHEVQGGSVLKPLVGKDNDGPGDAAIIRPLLDSERGVIVSCGINPSYGKIDPYWMAASAIDEALRQVIAVGGSLKSVMEDVKRAISMDFKKSGDLVYIAGTTRNELGGSEYFKTRGFTGNTVPRVNPRAAKQLMDCLSLATEKGLVRACHDCSDGGLGVALAEMSFAGGLGATIHLKSVPLGEPIDRDDFILFSESNSRFLVEVAPESKDEFEQVMKATSFAAIGQVTGGETVEVYGLNGRKVVSATLEKLKEAWQRPLRW